MRLCLKKNIYLNRLFKSLKASIRFFEIIKKKNQKEQAKK